MTVVRHRRATLAAWAPVVLVCAALLPTLKSSLGPTNVDVEGSESSHVERSLEQSFHGGSEEDTVVFYSPRHVVSDPTYSRAISLALAATRREAGVRSVLGPNDVKAVGQISTDEHVAFATIALSGSTRERSNRASRMQSAVARAGGHGVHVWLTGYSPVAKDITGVQFHDIERAELIGVPVALVVLLIALGAFVAAFVPLVLAAGALLLTYGVLTCFVSFLHFDNMLFAFVTMLGVGIGIDYALFVVSRFREELARAEREDRAESAAVAEAVGTAMVTSGRTILFSGVIVAFSMASLLVVHAPIFRELALGSLVLVTCTLLAVLTLLPALLATLGPRVNNGALPARLQPAGVRPGVGAGEGGWAKWALTIMRHPIPAAVIVIAVFGVAATPMPRLHYGISLSFSELSSTPSGEGAHVLSQAFTPGAVSPLEILVSTHDGRPLSGSDVTSAKALADVVENDSRVFAVVEYRHRASLLIRVLPSVPIDSSAASALVRHIRNDLAPKTGAHGRLTVLVGGATAKLVDLSEETLAKFPVVLALILGLSLVLLTAIFRSILLPIKAVVMNLLVTGAVLGVMVFVFQDGHGEHLLGFAHQGSIEAYLPLLVFAVLYGLSMDYEVFLIRRIKEEWSQSHDNRRAVAIGVEHTARPISTAAAIMVIVFASFVTAKLLDLKELGFALALAIALDATLVRLVLVPALMRLFGAWNWWLPAPLGRMLSRLGFD